MSGPSRKTGERITAIKALKGGKMAVYLGKEKLILSPNVFTESPLYVGKELDPLERRRLSSLMRSDSLYAYGLRLAAKGSYSAHEVRERLRKKASPDQDPKEIIFRLRQEGFLNDEELAKEYKEEREAALYGAERIKEKLRAKGISEAIIASLSFASEAQHARTVAKELDKRYAKLPLAARKSKAIAALIRRGYEPTVAKEAVASFAPHPQEEDASLRDLCAKTVKRYGRKYNGYELKAHCYKYLAAKGYASAEIKRCLEEYL